MTKEIGTSSIDFIVESNGMIKNLSYTLNFNFNIARYYETLLDVKLIIREIQ